MSGLTAQALRKRLEIRFERLYASDTYKRVGEAMVRHCQRKAFERRGHGFTSVWGNIAKKIRYRMEFHGSKRRVILSFGHPAAALKQFGGTIRAHGPWAEASPYPGLGGQQADFIPLALSGTPAKGKQLGKWKAMKFGAEGGTSYSPTRLHSMPLNRALASGAGDRFAGFAALVGKQVKANARNSRSAASEHKKFMSSAKLVFTKSSRKEMQPLYLLVKSCYVPPHPWIPSQDQIHSAVMRSFRKS